MKAKKSFLLECILLPLFFGTGDKTEQKRQKIKNNDRFTFRSENKTMFSLLSVGVVPLI